jgi:hypothetical protein
MSDVALRLVADAWPAVGVGLVPTTQAKPLVVLIIDDSDDDELASVLASTEGAADGYDGAWSARITDERLTICFQLMRRDDGWEREWTYSEPGGSILNAITARDHHVAIVPVIGDLSKFVRVGRGGAIVVATEASVAVASARAVARATAAP